MIQKKYKVLVLVIIIIAAIAFIAVDWSIDGFELFKAQKYEFYFQSWVSAAGLLFTAVMAITTFIIYKNTKIESLKWIALSFLLTTFAYMLLGYHSSYCLVCSDLSICNASHNYPSYIIVMALIIVVLSVLSMNLKKNIAMLKLFSYGLVIASLLMVLTLWISIGFMEHPALTLFEIETINLQGFVFVLPLILIVLSFVYFKRVKKITNTILFIFFLLFLSFIPQAYHAFVCEECRVLECSEFYTFAGLLMIVATSLVIYALDRQLDEGDTL